MTTVVDGEIGFLSTDGYVVVESGVRCRGMGKMFRGEDLKLLHKNLPTEEKEVEVSPDSNDAYVFGKQRLEIVSINDDKFWGGIRKLVSAKHEPPDPKDFETFYLDPRRLQKFSLVEPRAEYPLKFSQRQTIFDQPVFAWKYGPDLRGILAPLVYEALLDAYPEDHGEVL